MTWSILWMALTAIRRNAFRSFLTTLGIVIGVASVIAMISLGRGATQKVTQDISSLGNNLLIVFPGTERRSVTNSTSTPFTVDDARAIREEVSGIAGVAPSSGVGGRLVYGNRNWNCGITGSTNDYFHVRNWELETGRFFTDAEVRSGGLACVLGATVRRELFGTLDPLGARIRVATSTCEVVGVLNPKGRSTFGEDQDDFVVLPLVAFQRRIAGSEAVGLIAVSSVNRSRTQQVQRDIERLMRQRRRIRETAEDDFLVRDLQEISQVVGGVTAVLTALLGAIAAVSLLVGGIGIMNIMLVSVTERTREIGLRLAIGAQAHEVMAQFLVEAIVLSLIGGLLGIGLGIVGSLAVAKGFGVPFVFATDVIVGSFFFAGLVGVFFGFHPARKAARLNPIDALRYE